MLQILSIFKENGYSVIFSSAAKRSEYSLKLSKIGIQEQEIELNSSKFDRFVKDLNPDIVLFDRFMIEEQFGWRVAEAAPSAIRILDTEDLHFLRKARSLSIKDGKDAITECYPYLKNENMAREIASIIRCDFSIMISEFEIELLLSEFNIPETKLLYLPLLLRDDEIKRIDSTINFECRTHFVTIGNFLHPPNIDSVFYLKKSVWPQIHKRLPDVELHIYGAYPNHKIFSLHDEKSGFLIKGRADNVYDTLLTYRVMLAPLRFGAGQKGKLLDAMHAELPSLTTPIGAEGMGEASTWPGYICANEHELVDKAIQIYLQKSDWIEKTSKISSLISKQFKFSKMAANFWADIQIKCARIQEIRASDYFGEVLRNQSNNATKYMGKWIEEKNKNKTNN